MLTFLQFIGEDAHPHGDFIRDEHGKPQSFFHGTTHAFSEFTPKTDKKMQHGFGIHFTHDPEKASRYATTDVHHKKLGKAPNVHKVHLRAKNVLDTDQMYHKDTHPQHYALHHALYKGTGRKPYVSKEGHFVVSPDVTNPNRAQKLIQQHGFDAVKYKAKEGRSTGYGMAKTDEYPAITVFHPGQVHSAFHPIKESDDDDDWGWKSPIKGWMSPSGKAHLFHHRDEHKENHHPEYLKQGGKNNDSIQHAQAKGFVRFGGNYSHIHGSHHYVHYDATHPQGRETALKALQQMKPKHNDLVTVSGTAGLFKNGRRIPKAMKQLSREASVPTRQAYELLNQGKDTTPKTDDLRKQRKKLLDKEVHHPVHGTGNISWVGLDRAQMKDKKGVHHFVDANFLRSQGHIK